MSDTRRYRVINQSETPPHGWVWRHSDGAILRTEESFAVLLSRVEDFLLDRGEDPAKAFAEIHQTTAIHLIAIGRADLIEPIGRVRRSREHYASGAKAAFLKWWKESPIFAMLSGKVERGENVFVDQSEADRRAAICTGGTQPGMRCQFNVTPESKSWAEEWTDAKMLKSVEGRSTAYQDRLAVCTVCSCELRASIWWTPDIIAASQRDKSFVRRFPDFCWKKKISNPTP